MHRLLALWPLFLVSLLRADDGLSKLNPEVLSKTDRTQASGATEREIRRRTSEVNQKNREAWNQITNRKEWEAFRDSRISKLSGSLLQKWPMREKLRVVTTGTQEGDGFRISNVAYESRPGVWVAANLYRPAEAKPAMPGLVIVPSHHNSKFEKELFDMGTTWARAGCLVLIADPFGYGERRLHPFNKAEDYPKPFRVGRQDYFHRYDSGVQLQMLGDSLMGWMVWDLMRGFDLLTMQEGIDPKRLIILGSVAGGGDPAGVTAALDERIACCVPFNFGGPQPESKYPLPEDSETTFNYLAGTYWDSTRGLRLGGRDDFLHWVITSSIAPRKLIHAHEFSWDREHDPIWKRYQKIWGDFYSAKDSLGYAHGTGTLKGMAPEASHCNNIGPIHRKLIHQFFEEWFSIRVKEYSSSLKTDSLRCFTDPFRKEANLRKGTELLQEVGELRTADARTKLKSLPAPGDRAYLQQEWNKLLGPIQPEKAPIVKATSVEGSVERVVLEVEPDFLVPLLVLKPQKPNSQAIIGIAQTGKSGFLANRSDELKQLLDAGYTIVLPDLRGTGETRSGSSRGRDSNDTSLSLNLQLFGETLLGQRLRDLRSVLSYLRSRKELKQIALWGDSFSATNSLDLNFNIPHAVEGRPRESEPLGDLLVMLTMLFDDQIRAGYTAGGLESYREIVSHFAVLVPHDTLVPGMLTLGEPSEWSAILKPLKRTGLVDHLNRKRTDRESAAKWLIEQR